MDALDKAAERISEAAPKAEVAIKVIDAPQPKAVDAQAELREDSVLRNPKVIWYGPYACGCCGGTIIRASRGDGGLELDAPFGHHYPNHVWTKHVCPIGVPELPTGYKLRHHGDTIQKGDKVFWTGDHSSGDWGDARASIGSVCGQPLPTGGFWEACRPVKSVV